MELAVTLPALVVVLALLSGAEGRLRPSSTIQGDEGRPLRKVELLVFDSKTAPGIEVGVHIVLEPGWYTYWTNPGDAGLAPGFTWHLPAGLENPATLWASPRT
jgi:thiol:disulfide interchange protein DsbD